MADDVVVVKRNIAGQETWRYHGRLIEMESNRIVLEAYFDRPDTNLHGMLLGKGDRFVETYYTDRWYNIFEIHAREDDRLRGWYCNITRPATFNGSMVTYVDLALDLLVFPDGRQVILDEDEFQELDILPDVRCKAREALAELQAAYFCRLHQS